MKPTEVVRYCELNVPVSPPHPPKSKVEALIPKEMVFGGIWPLGSEWVWTRSLERAPIMRWCLYKRTKRSVLAPSVCYLLEQLERTLEYVKMLHKVQSDTKTSVIFIIGSCESGKRGWKRGDEGVRRHWRENLVRSGPARPR